MRSLLFFFLLVSLLSTAAVQAEALQDTCDTGIQDTIIVGSVRVPGPLWPDSIGVPVYIWADEPIAAVTWGLRPLDNRIRVSSFSKEGSVLPTNMFMPSLVDTINNQIGFGWVDFTGFNPVQSPQGLLGTVWVHPLPNISVGEYLFLDSTSLLPVYPCALTSIVGFGTKCPLRYVSFRGVEIGGVLFGVTDSTSDFYFSFDEMNGAIVYDRAGHKRDGRASAGCSWASGVKGAAISLDGIDDYVTLPIINEYCYPGPLTVSIWFKCTTYRPTNQDIVCHGGPGCWDITHLENKLRIGLYPQWGTWSGVDMTIPLDHQWHQAAFSWTPWSTVVMFLDGDSITQVPAPQLYLSSNPDIQRRIGCFELGGRSDFFEGLVDEFKVWYRALSPHEIQQEYLRVDYVACGDVDASRQINITDVVYMINFMFGGGVAPSKPSTADVSCDGRIDIGDAVYMINYFFAGGAVPCAACPM